MMAALDKTGVEIEVEDVLIRRGITQKDTAEVVPVQLAATVT